MKNKYKIIYDSSVEGLEKKINNLSVDGYRAVNVTSYPVATAYGVIALLEYAGAEPN